MPLIGFPEDKLPQCWSDDVRMNALFAPFRLKSVNPESWDMKMKFWSDMLRQWCKYKKDPIITAADAKFAFKRNGRTSACLDIVVEEMYRNGELCPPSKYQQILHNGPEGWVKWGARLAFKPAAFALTAVSSLLLGSQSVDKHGMPVATIESTQRFVMEAVIEELATDLLASYPPTAERMGTIDELLIHSGSGYSRETFGLLLGWLVSQGYAVKKGDIVKLAGPDKKTTTITEADVTLAKLMQAETKLIGDESRLLKEVASADGDARAALQVGNRLAAKNHLRRKKRTEQRLSKCTATLENVRHLQTQMREVDDNAVIVDTYRSTSQAMKKTMVNEGLEEDSVHNTMDDLKDVMEAYNEVEKALAGNAFEDFDAAELEEELKELMSNPGPAGGGGTPGKEDRDKAPSNLTPTPASRRRISERDFVFDGEEALLAELKDLDVEDTTPIATRGRPKTRAKVALPAEMKEWQENEPPTEPQEKGESRPWYPPLGEHSNSETTWSNINNNNNESQDNKHIEECQELRLDERLHPGQQLNVDYTKPPKLYGDQFQVKDHKMSSTGVWLYNTGESEPVLKDANRNVDVSLAHSTEYFGSGSPGKSAGNFQMAPGGERKPLDKWPQGEKNTVEDLERRLKNLRGYNS